MKLCLRLTRVSPTLHRFEYRGEGGQWAGVLLETRSTLEHDLIHYALETEAHLRRSFYGSLAATQSYAALSNLAADDQNSEAAQTERIAGALTPVMKGTASPRQALDSITDWFSACEQQPPEWLTQELILRVQKRFSALLGQWRATPFHAAMELIFETDR